MMARIPVVVSLSFAPSGRECGSGVTDRGGTRDNEDDGWCARLVDGAEIMTLITRVPMMMMMMMECCLRFYECPRSPSFALILCHH